MSPTCADLELLMSPKTCQSNSPLGIVTAEPSDRISESLCRRMIVAEASSGTLPSLMQEPTSHRVVAVQDGPNPDLNERTGVLGYSRPSARPRSGSTSPVAGENRDKTIVVGLME